MALHSHKGGSASSHPARRTSVNQILRAAYRRFTRDKYTRRALNVFIPRPTGECTASLRKAIPAR